MLLFDVNSAFQPLHRRAQEVSNAISASTGAQWGKGSAAIADCE